jgi:hypothetical protein
MDHKEHHIDRLFVAGSKVFQLQVLREARILDDRPRVLHDEWQSASYEALAAWIPRHRRAITRGLLRLRDLLNSDVSALIADGDFDATVSRLSPVSVIVHCARTAHEIAERLEGGLPITDLAAASAMMAEMSFVLTAASFPLDPTVGERIPRVVVRPGSIQFSVGGGLVASGLGLIVACSAGLVAAPVVGPVVGGTLASIGLIDLVVDWRKKLAETAKAKEESNKLKIENDKTAIAQTRRLQVLEIRKKELELQEAIAKQERENESDSVAFSGNIPRAIVIRQSELWGISEEHANHLLNRAMPTFLELKRYFESISAEQRRSGSSIKRRRR